MHETLALMKCTLQLMHDELGKRELCSGPLSSIDGPMDKGLLVTMLTGSSRDRLKFPYGVGQAVLLTKEDCTWQTPTLRLLQTYGSHRAMNFES